MAATPMLAAELELQIPVACEIGRTCEIQNYVDRDPGSGVRDYRCGTSTYDAHDGVDFRLPALPKPGAEVAVLAAADGRVLRARDGVGDVSVKEGGRAAVAGAECGNGLVIDHGEGWETQYCHLARRSVRVRPGDAVKAGDRIGAVGLSGLTEYPHLHFTLRHDGRVTDPFAADAADCGAGRPLWSASVQAALGYRPRVVLNSGFATGPVTNEMIESGAVGDAAPTPQSPALVAYLRVINARKGDVQTLTLRGPDGTVIAENTAAALDRDKAQWMMFAGLKRPAAGWTDGAYEATYVATNDGVALAEHIFELDLK